MSLRNDFRKVLDIYVEKYFQGTKTHNHFLGCLGFYIGGIEPEKNLSQINSSFKVRFLSEISSLNYSFDIFRQLNISLSLFRPLF